MATDKDELAVRLRHTAADMVGNYDGEHDDWAKLIHEAADRIEAADKRIKVLEELVNRALLWIDQDDCSQMGPAEDAAHTRIIRSLEAALQQKEREDG